MKPLIFARLQIPCVIISLLTVPFVTHAQEDALANVTARSSDNDSIPAILNYVQTQEKNGKSTVEPKAVNTPAQNNNAAQKLRAKVNVQQSWLTEKDKTIRDLQAQLDMKSLPANSESENEKKLREQVKELQAKLDAANASQQQTQQAQAKLTESQQNILELQKQAKTAEDKLADVSKKLQDNQLELMQFGKEKLQLVTSLEALKAEQDKTKTQLNDKADAVTKISSQKEDAVKQLQAQLDTKSAAIQTASESEKALREQLKQLQLKLDSADAEKYQALQTQEQLKASQQKVVDLQQVAKSANDALADANKKLSDNEQLLLKSGQEKEQLATSLDAQKTQGSEIQTQLDAKTSDITKLTEQIAKMQSEGTKKVDLDLKQPKQQQAYAIGISLGNDVLQELTTRAAQGVPIERDVVLRGIEDLFADKVALDEASRNKALEEASQSVYKNLNKIEQQASTEGKKYQTKFAKQKGVELKDGVYSKIDYAGQGAIKPDDIVTVVMKETLPDGTIISDMEAAGKVWTQPLSAYPPIFKGPLQRLGNHGTITIVVPPDLAYGSQGLPPKIPPGATMTYNVRIVDVEKK